MSELIEATKGEFILGSPHTVVTNISTDSRTARKGDFFFAIVGKNFDGHDYLKEVIKKQAAGLVVSKKDLDLGQDLGGFPSVVIVEDTTKALGDLAGYYRRKFNLKVIGITGSNGKTTTKQILSSILNQVAPCLSSEKNFNNQLGVPFTLFGLTGKHRFAVVEMGTSFPGEITRLSDIGAPDLGIVTNIGFSHLENFKDLNGVYQEKIQLLRALPADGFGIVNADDTYLKNVSKDLKDGKITTFGIDSKADVTASEIKLWPDLPSFTLTAQGKSFPVQLPVYGRFNIYNALAAAATALKLNVNLDTIKKGIETFKPVGMRMETFDLMSGAVIVNDAYNANPSSMRESILSFIQTFPDKERIVVLGDMLELGDVSEAEHTRLGEFLESLPLSRIFLYGPRIKAAAEKLGDSAIDYFDDKDELATSLKGVISQDTVILFKASRGMKLEEVIEKVR